METKDNELILQVKIPDGVEYQIDTTNLESSRGITAEQIKTDQVIVR